VKNWIPISIDLRSSPAAVTWLEVGETAFAEPFFQQTVERFCTDHPGARRLTTGLEELLATETAAGWGPRTRGGAHEGLPWEQEARFGGRAPGAGTEGAFRGPVPGRREPAGFIFHMSRCGSTLVANLLRALRHSRVIAEAPPLNQILGMPAASSALADRWGCADALAVLRAAVHALGGRPGGPYFVKFSSWNVLYLPLVRAAFPEVPWVFVYRHPVEVMVANLARQGSWMRARSAPAVAAVLTGLDPGEVAGLAPEEYCARALGHFCRAAVESPAEGRLLVNHRDLSLTLLPRLLAFFRVTASEEERAAMAAMLRFDAKDPERHRLFTDDSVARQAAASESVRALAEQWVMELYERLEREREAAADRPAAIPNSAPTS
jgi:hypothetical protein